MSVDTIGKFTVTGTLGKGANSSILHIRREEDGKAYALKVVPVEDEDDVKYLEQARHEFRVAQMLDHPNLLKIYALEEQKKWFKVKKAQLLLEFVNGKTLDQFPAMPIPKLVQVFEKIAGGLVHMHRRNVFHADLKPLNVMISNTGQVKVIDFGLAWIKGEDKGRVQGTPEYMAPETATRKMVNERSDIFNFGATMYRLVTGKNPPPVLSPLDSTSMNADLWTSKLKGVCELAPRCPEPLAAIIHHCLAYKALERPERMSEIQGELDKLVDELVKRPEDKLQPDE